MQTHQPSRTVGPATLREIDMRKIIAALAVLLAMGVALPASAGNDSPQQALRQESAPEITCPVMGGVVKDPSTAATSVYKGRTYYFCCAGCKPLFDADPEKYIGNGKPRTP